MPFPMRIQPIDFNLEEESAVGGRPVMQKSRLKRLFERQSQLVRRDCSGGEFEPTSVCLAKMVQNFIEGNNNNGEKHSGGGRNCCNCFSGNTTDSSDDEWDCFTASNPSSSTDAIDILKSLVPCVCVSERNLLADTAKMIEKNRNCKRKDESCRKVVMEGLLGLGYNASICKSRWDKSPSCPAGEYEYIDVIIKGERLLIDIDFRSEFEIARPTKSYKSIIQTLPYIFVGKEDRLHRIISIVCEAAEQSLKKKGMHIPPWRKVEYVQAKWLSPHPRADQDLNTRGSCTGAGKKQPLARATELKLGCPERNLVEETEFGESVFDLSDSSGDELMFAYPP